MLQLQNSIVNYKSNASRLSLSGFQSVADCPLVLHSGFRCSALFLEIVLIWTYEGILVFRFFELEYRRLWSR
jgi:hypothetical protein